MTSSTSRLAPRSLLTLTAHCMRLVRERMPQVGEQIDAVIADRVR